MIYTDDKGYFIPATIVKGGKGTTGLITIPIKSWNYFPVDSRVKIYPNETIFIVRPICLMTNGTQRIVRIPYCDRDYFKHGEKVKVYPFEAFWQQQ